MIFKNLDYFNHFMIKMEYLTVIIIAVVCLAIVLTLILTLSNFKSNVTPVVKVNDVDVLFNTEDIESKDILFVVINNPVLEKALTSVKAPTFTINWGDGTDEVFTYETYFKQVTHTYVNDGEYTIKITGDYTGLEVSSVLPKQVTINDNLTINELNVNSSNLYTNNGIVNLDKLYPTIQELGIGSNQFLNDKLEETLLKFPLLTKLNIDNKNLTSFNTQGFENLQFLGISFNPQITSLDVTNLTNLLGLNINNTGITTLDVTNLTNLEGLYLDNSGITNVVDLLSNLPNKTKLKILSCDGVNITGIFTLSTFTNLESLRCNNNSGLIRVIVTNLTKLSSLICNTGNPNINSIYGINSGLSTINVTSLNQLSEVVLRGSYFNQTSADNLAGQLLLTGVQNGTLDLQLLVPGPITKTGNLNTLSTNKAWTVRV